MTALTDEMVLIEKQLRCELPEVLKPLFERYLSIRNQVELESENRDFELGLVLGARLLPNKTE